MKLSNVILLSALSLTAQQQDKPQGKPQLVQIIDIKDNTHDGAALNVCFDLPQERIYEIKLTQGHRLKIYDSDNCGDSELYTISGNFTVNGNSEGWKSAVVPYNTPDFKPSRKFRLKEASGHRRHGSKHHSYRAYRE